MHVEPLGAKCKEIRRIELLCIVVIPNLIATRTKKDQPPGDHPQFLARKVSFVRKRHFTIDEPVECRNPLTISQRLEECFGNPNWKGRIHIRHVVKLILNVP